MSLPFSAEQFLLVFERYNQAIWPLQLLAYVLGLSAVWATGQRAARPLIATFILAALWIWTGVVYHLAFFSAINPAAYLFGALFILQGALLLRYGTGKKPLLFQFQSTARGVVGALFISYALIGYPLLGLALGHTYPRMPVFGVTPCPLTIFTLGFLLWAKSCVPKAVWLIPVGWSLLGATAAWQMGMWEDLGLLVAGLLAGVWLYTGRWRAPQGTQQQGHLA